MPAAALAQELPTVTVAPTASPVEELVVFPEMWSSITVEGESRYTATSAYTLRIVNDAVDEDSETFEIQLQHVPGVSGLSFGVGTTVATILDDDTRGVEVSPVDVTVTEGDSAGASYEVVLTSWPTDDVSVSVTAPSNSDLSVDESSLFFFADEWNEAQTVTVTAAHDTGTVGDESVTITHDAEGGDYGSLVVDGVAVTIEDDDALVSVTADALTVAEGGNATFTVSLARGARSRAEVVVSYSVRGTAASGDEYAAPSGSLTIPQGSTSGDDHDRDRVGRHPGPRRDRGRDPDGRDNRCWLRGSQQHLSYDDDF